MKCDPGPLASHRRSHSNSCLLQRTVADKHCHSGQQLGRKPQSTCPLQDTNRHILSLESSHNCSSWPTKPRAGGPLPTSNFNSYQSLPRAPHDNHHGFLSVPQKHQALPPRLLLFLQFRILPSPQHSSPPLTHTAHCLCPPTPHPPSLPNCDSSLQLSA